MSLISATDNEPGSPLVSVVLLTKDGGDLLRRTIDLLLRQTTTFSYEIVAVDSGSSDGFCGYAREVGARVFEIPPESFSYGATRDFAFGRARGTILVTLSQDAMPQDECWLQTLVQPCLAGTAQVVQGGEISPGEEIQVFFWDRARMFYFTSEDAHFLRKVGPFTLSCVSMAITRTAWEATGFAGAPFSEDKVLHERLWRRSIPVVRSSAVVIHGHRYSMRTLLHRCYMEGVGWAHVDTKYRLVDVARDLARRWVWKAWATAALRGELRTWPERLFPLVRPLAVYLGFRAEKRSHLRHEQRSDRPTRRFPSSATFTPESLSPRV